MARVGAGLQSGVAAVAPAHGTGVTVRTALWTFWSLELNVTSTPTPKRPFVIRSSGSTVKTVSVLANPDSTHTRALPLSIRVADRVSFRGKWSEPGVAEARAEGPHVDAHGRGRRVRRGAAREREVQLAVVVTPAPLGRLWLDGDGLASRRRAARRDDRAGGVEDCEVVVSVRSDA